MINYLSPCADDASVPWVAGSEAAGAPLLPARWAGATRQERIQRAAAPLVALYDAEQVPEEDMHVIENVHGHDVTATLVNVVYLSTVRPRQGPAAVSLALLYQSLVGIASFGHKSNGSPELAFKTRAPFRAKHSFTPLDLRMQETAATSDVTGEHVLRTTLALLGEGTPAGFEVRARQRTNEVYTAYLPFPLDLGVIERRLPKVTHVPQLFVGRIIEPPDDTIKLLVFPKGIVICVGSCHSEQMKATIRRYMPVFRAAAVARGTKRARRAGD